MAELSNLARQAEGRSGFIAGLVARYQQSHNLGDQGLADLLHCSLDDLIHLKLCALPRQDHFQEDLVRIAEHVHANAGELARVLSN